MFDAIGDAIKGMFEDLLDLILYNLVYKVLYAIEVLFCKIVSWLEGLFRVFTSIDKANYDGADVYLIDIFFSNSTISRVYWGMAGIGMTFAFMFAIISMVRKTFDLDDKVKMSTGKILRNLLKSIVLIVGLNAGVAFTVQLTNVTMEAVSKVFDDAANDSGGGYIDHYTNEQYAAMGRIYNTIGNYSLNPSYKSRYNINSCYNEIRGDLRYLAEQHVFDVYYETTNEDGEIIATWQAVLQRLANAADYDEEYALDGYNEGIANAVSDAMDILKKNPSFEALEEYREPKDEEKTGDVGFDRIIFLIATMGVGNTAAAKNEAYNRSPSLTDAVRNPYYRGVKNIYDLDQVNEDFDISLSKTNYVVAYVAAIALGINMLLIIISAVARIFNMLFLYIVAPPLVGVMPLDDGAKFKQWLTAFIIQAFSIFATVISMRLYLIFIPIIFSPQLALSDNSTINVIGKLLFLYGGFEAIGKANGILTGILADNAGYQSVMAGDMRSSMKKLGGGAAAVASPFGKAAVSGAKLVGKGVVAGIKKAYGARKAGSAAGSGSSAPLPDKSSIGKTSGGASGSAGAGAGGAAGAAGQSASGRAAIGAATGAAAGAAAGARAAKKPPAGVGKKGGANKSNFKATPEQLRKVFGDGPKGGEAAPPASAGSSGDSPAPEPQRDIGGGDQGAPPPGGEAPAPEGEKPAAGGEAPPAAGGEAPAAGGEAPPAGDGAPPAGGEAPAAGGEAPPAGDGAPPAGGGAPAAGGEAPAAGGEAPPAGDGAPPAGGGAPPAGGGAPAAGGEAPAAGGEAPPAGDGAPPAGGGAPPAGGGAPAAGGEAPPAGDGAPPAGGGAPPASGAKAKDYEKIKKNLFGV